MTGPKRNTLDVLKHTARAFLVLMVLGTNGAVPGEIAIEPSRDATLFEDAAGALGNDDGAVSIEDAIRIPNYLFAGGDPLPPPFGACDIDRTPDGLACTIHPPCRGG